MPKAANITQCSMLIACVLAGTSSPSPLQAQPSTPQAAQASRVSGIAAWGIASSDLPADPDVRFGRLANGMRYALKRGNMPKGSVSIRLAIDAGAREESDAETGVAHFLEHMAFNGSTHIPEGELVPKLERLGLAFGVDTNAETGFEHTTYQLDVPGADATKLTTALSILREIASELTIAQDAVERERGVIANEYQARNDVSRRRAANILSAALPGGRLGERIADQAKNLPLINAAMLRGFYVGYYRPEKATLVMVGDFEPADMQPLIERQFGNWRGAGAARQSYAPIVKPHHPADVATFVDRATPEIIELHSNSPYSPPANSLAEQRDELLRGIGARALTNRLAVLSRAADSPTLGGQVQFQSAYRSFNHAAVTLIAKDGQWRRTAQLAEQEWRRAMLHGFTAAEITEAKANLETSLSNAATQASAVPSILYAMVLTQASLENRIVMSAKQSLQIYHEIADSITPEAVTQAFRQRWQQGFDLVHVSTKTEIGGEAVAIRQALQESSQVAVAPPVAGSTAKFAYNDFGPAGKIVSDRRIDDLGIRTITFVNGMRLNLKKTDFEPGRISFQMDVGTGSQSFPHDKPGLGLMTQVALGVDGLKAHSPDELRQLLAGRQVSLGMSVGEDALSSAGVTTPDDLELQLQLLAARLTATGFRSETQAQWQAVAPVLAKDLGASAPQIFGLALNYMVAGTDARFGFDDPEVLTKRSLDEVRAVIEPQLQTGSVDVGLIGDFDEDKVIAAFARTLGALPVRATTNAAASPPPHFTAERRPHILRHQGAADQAVLALSWPTEDGSNLADSLARSVLAKIFELRLTEVLREKLGASYSPQAVTYERPKDDDFGHLTVFFTVDPSRLDEAGRVTRSIAAELAADPVSVDLLQRARQPIEERLREAVTRNAGWGEIVTRAQRDPFMLDRRRQRDALLAGITPAEIRAQARKYLTKQPLETRVVAVGIREN